MATERQTQRPSPHRSESEAAQYLRQFQAENKQPSRPRTSRFNTSAPALSSTPSLSHTPTSSISTSMSCNSAALSSPYRPLPPRSTPRAGSVGFATRSVDLVTPIVSYRASASWASSGHEDYVDHTIIPTSLKSYPATEKSLEGSTNTLTDSYKKRHSMPASQQSQAQSSLMQLFRFEEMRAAPKYQDLSAAPLTQDGSGR